MRPVNILCVLAEQSDLQDSKLIADANTVKSHLESTQASAPVYEAFEKTLLKADKGVGFS